MRDAITTLPSLGNESGACRPSTTEATPLQTAVTTVHDSQALTLPAPFLKTLAIPNGHGRRFFLVETRAETLVLRTLDDHLDTTLVPRLQAGRNLPRSELLSAVFSPEFSSLARGILDLPEAELDFDGTLRIPEEVRRLEAGARLRLCLVEPFPASKRPAPPWRLWLFIADQDLPDEIS